MRHLNARKLLICCNLIFIFLLLSCKSKDQRFYLTEHITYFEAPAEYGLADINRNTYNFKPMSKDQRENFSLVMEEKNTYLWLKLDFVIPSPLKLQDIAFYIPQLHSATRVYINGKFIKQYGAFPPNEYSAGSLSQIFLFPKEALNVFDTNTIYIQCWPGAYGCLYGDVCLGKQEPLELASNKVNYHNTKIILVFSGALTLLTILYLFLYYLMKRFETNKEYLYYALTLFYTLHFLIPFLLPEVTWIKPNWVSYLFVLKFFGGVGAVSTIYFANSFILTYVGHKATIKNTTPRLVLFLISLIGIMSIRTYSSFTTLVLIFGSISLLQFINSVSVLIKAFSQPENKAHAIQLLFGFSPVLITLICDFVLRIILDNKTTPIFTIYGWQATIVIFLTFLLVRFSRFYLHNVELKTQLSDINTHLEDLVGIRTSELSEANFKLSLGLETVSHVQNNFLPPKSRSFRGWDLCAYYKPLDNEVSGDLYDYYYNSGKLDGIGLFDVSGHGISAGLMTILAKGIISQQFKTGIINEEPISEILNSINKDYIREKVNIENYITGILMHFQTFNDKDICSIEMANAGHPYPIFYNSETNTVTELKHTDSSKQFGFLGIDGLEVSFPSIFFTSRVNDIIVCFTDGLTESCNSKKEEFSKERLMRIIKENNKKTADEISAVITSELNDFIGNEPLEDDVSFIVLKRTNSSDYIEEI